MSVDLPEPDGPMIAVNAPGREVDVDAVERADLGGALRRRPWSATGRSTATVTARHARLVLVDRAEDGGVHGGLLRVR